MMKQHKKSCVVILSFLLASLLVLFADYLDLFSRMGIQISRFNADLLNIWASATTTIGIFICTYFLIEKRSIDKQKNQYRIAVHLLTLTYMECKQLIKQLDDDRIKKILLKRTDYNAVHGADTIVSKFASLPFKNDTHIMQMGIDGAIPHFYTETYIKVKNDFAKYVSFCVDFYDLDPSALKDNLLLQVSKAEKEIQTGKEIVNSTQELKEQ